MTGSFFVDPEQLSKQSGGRADMVITIRATKGWGSLNLGEIWRYRELLWFLAAREVKVSYRQTALGPLWFILKPLISMLIFSLLFGGIAKLPSEGVPYPLFTYTALIPWTYFAGATTMSVGSLVTRMQIISKVYFPRLLVPFAAVLTNLVDLGMSFLVLLLMMAYYRMAVSWEVLFLPLYVLLAAATALSVGLWSATLAVRYRDVTVGMAFALNIWMFLTPVAYSASLIPERWQLLYQMNPMYWVVEGFRWALLGIGTPAQPLMLIPVGVVVVLFISGAFAFRRTERTIVDLL